MKLITLKINQEIQNFFPPLSTKIKEFDAWRSVRIIDLLGHQTSKNLCDQFEENSFTVYYDIHDGF